MGSSYDRETLRVMRRVLGRDSNCIDVGAYRGEILRHMLRLAPAGNVIAIEPVAANCEYLAKKYGNAVIYNVALSDEEGEADFYHVVGRPARSGLRKQNYPDPNENINVIRIPVRRLDSIIPESMQIDFIKIDVEGAELSVLRGAENLITSSKPVIVFEHAAESASQFGNTTGELFDLVVSCYGLNISSMSRWLRGHAPYSRNEFVHRACSGEEFYFIGYRFP
jgi:FkbM family methyltransferase